MLCYNKGSMKKIILVLFFALTPFLVRASTANDFTVNPQPTYAVPPGSKNVLILDLNSAVSIKSIKIRNAGTAQQYDITKLLIFKDGPSPGWNGDESEVAKKSSSPFWDAELSGDFSQGRIFVTIDISSTTYSGKTIKAEAYINTDNMVIGLERRVLAGASAPSAPMSPLAKNGEALSTSTIRWYFMDLSNNEFGFKILDSNSNTVVKKDEADLSYLDETGLQPDTEYQGRMVMAFNDRGESPSSALAVFPATRTLAEKKATSTKEIAPQPTSSQPTAVQEVKKEPTLFETIQIKIVEIQQKINELRNELNKLLQKQAAAIWTALQGFFQSLPGM